MVTFGRKPTRNLAIPSNRGLIDRTNQKLEGYAKVRAEHFTTSLGVDAPNFYFWHKEAGSIPCSCTAARQGPNVDIEVGGRTKTLTTITKNNNSPEFRPIRADYGSKGVADIFAKPEKTKQPTLKDKLTTETNNIPGSFDDHDEISDVEEFLDKASNGTADFNDPLNMFGDKIIACPVCLDAGYIDAWNVHGGKRFVFDTSNAFLFECEAIDIKSNESPTELVTLKESARAFWSFKLPLIWDKILRINVYNGIDPIAPYLYNWVYKDQNNSTGYMTLRDLNQLNNTGSILKLSLEFNEPDITFTHAEIVFAFADSQRAQIPEIQQGYENEFLDWSVNLSVELPPDLQISEGDYLTESKYKRIWKISTLTKKITAGGTVFAMTADLRALHAFEKKFSQLALFGDNFQNFSSLR